MAQYDGSIRIDTGINTAGIKKGVQEIAKDLERLKSIQKEFLDIGGSKEDSTYKEREKEIKKLEQALKSLNDTQKETRGQGKVPDKHWNQLKTDVEKYARALKELQSQGKFFGDEDYDKVYLAWKNATDAVKEYQAELSKQTAAGQTKIAEQEAKAAEKREAAQRKAEEQAERALQKENERIQKQIESEAKLATKEAERQAKIQAEAAEEERLNQIRANAVSANDEIIAKVERIKQLEQEIADLKAVERTEGYADYDDRIKELSELKQDVKEYRDSLSEVPERFAKMRAAAQKTFDVIRFGLSMVGNLGKRALSGLSSMAKKAFSAITSGSKQSNSSLSGGLKTILKYGLGIRSLYALFNKIRSGIQAGFTNLMGYSDSFANSVQSVKNSMSTLGSQIAGAFRPIVEMVIPWLNSLIGVLTKAMTYAAQFIAVLSGKSTFTKAKQIQDAYNKSLGSTAKAADKARGALAKFDDLDVLEKKEDTSSGGAGDLDSLNNMFEEVEVDNKWKNIADWFREMWGNSDFSALGKLLGEKLKEALENIDWNPIQEMAQRAGKSLATLINGGVEVDGLANSIGQTLGNAFNTAITGINAFLDNTHWDSVGKFIGEGLNGLVDAIDWGGLGHFFAEKWNAIFETIGEAAKTFDWENFGASLAESFNTWIADFNWEENGAYLGELVKGILDTLITFIEETDWQELGNKIADFIGSIDWTGIMERLSEGIGAALGGLSAFLFGLIEDAWNSVIEWWDNVAFKDGKFTMQGLLNGILEVFSNIGDWIVEHIFTPFIDGFCEAFGIHSPSTVMAEIGVFIMKGLLNGISSLVDSVKEIWNNLKISTVNIFNGIWTAIKGVINSILGGVEKMANGVVNAINAMIRALNAIHFDIPDWVPPLGGKSFGFDIGEIPQVSIPKLATGAVIRGGNPFMAILGDQPAGKTNIEAPAGLIKDMVAQGIAEAGIGSRESIPVNINLIYDGETTARVMIPDILSELGRQGYDVNLLGYT